MVTFTTTDATNVYQAGSVLFYAREEAPASFDVSQAMALDGCFVFTYNLLTSTNVASFGVALSVFLASRPFARIAWISNPNEYAKGLQGTVIEAVNGQTNRNSTFTWRNLSLLIQRQTVLSATDTGLTLTLNAAEQMPLLVGYGQTRLNILTSDITIPFEGDTVGCVQFSLDTTGDQRDLLDMGLRTYYRRVDEADFEWTGDEYYITSQRFRVFDTSETIPFNVTLDPFNLLDANRSFLSIAKPTDSESFTDLVSYYRTNYGYNVHLTPNETSRYVFELKYETSADTAPYTLTLAGDFQITVPAYDDSRGIQNYDDNFVCGLSGLEYVKLDREGGAADTLHFVTKGSAYAPDFIPASSPPDTGEPLLSNFAMTSWCYISQAGTPPIYYAQPDESTLYKALADNDTFLEYLEVPTTPLPAQESLSTGQAFPMLPYSGAVTMPGELETVDENTYFWNFPIEPSVGTADTGLTIAKQFEQQILSPKRREQIFNQEAAGLSTPLSDDAEVHEGVTPQGLYAQYTADYETLSSLVLAVDTNGNALQMEQIPRNDPLRAALQSNQLFAVINNPDALSSFLTQYNLDIQGWNFDFDPTLWEQRDTMVILKFTDRPLIELAANTGMWSFPTHFTTGKTAARLALQRVIEDVETVMETGSIKEQTKYKPLSEAISQDGWTGILALNVTVPPNELPDELRGLAAGIDADEFFAAYVGVDTTPISVSDGSLSQQKSSTFALIDYQDDSIPLPTESGYNFQVTSLSVLFENSEIKDFAAEIVVTLDVLFSEATQLQNSADGRNIITLKGTTENHDGEITYGFSFTGENRFTLPNSPAITDVTIIKAQFATATSTSATVSSKFNFWGQLNFKDNADFDALSFGWETPADASTPVPEADQHYLSFSNLVVSMTFDEATPTERTFSFDARNLAFDMRNSTVRSDSLYNKFPLKFSAFMSKSTSIDDEGYMPVTSPLNNATISGDWYGMTYDLELGSLGELAGNVGLVLGVMVAWAPQGTDLWIGLRLPGATGGKKEITLQGVLKLAFKSIIFDKGDAGYVLKLRNITLQVLTLSFPPNARTEIIIFGDPDGSADDQSVGWYAAYAKGDSSGSL